MDRMDLQVLTAARRWAAEGRRFALVTVARTWGSAPRPAGAWLALREDGQIEGSVSGGCIEGDLMARMADGRLEGSSPFKLVYGVDTEDAIRFGLPCGGTLELVVEPAPDAHLLEQLAAMLEDGRLAARTVELGRYEVRLEGASPGDTLRWDGQRLTTVHGPQWRLLVIGAGQVSRYLASMAQALDWAVTVCEPRREYAEGWDVPGTELLTCLPDDALLALGPDARLAVVALTHDPRLDDMLLLEALKSPAFYVGALGSQRTNQQRRERLARHFDLTPEELARLHGPVGLPIGSHTPPEIALSILAEITALKNGALPGTRSQAASLHESAACGVA